MSTSNSPETSQPAAAQPEIKKGMKDVVVAESSISHIDGQAGKLIYRGYTIEDLAENATFEEVCYLLLFGKLPNQTELDGWKQQISNEMKLPDIAAETIKLFPRNCTPMAVMRTAVSAMSEVDPDTEDGSDEADIRIATRLIARMPLVLAGVVRHQRFQSFVDPKPGASIAENLLYCMNGEAPTPTMVRATDMYLVLLAEHGFNASTFATLVTTGTRGDFYSAIVSAIGTLKGPLHGGANRAAMEMLEKFESPEDARQKVKAMLANKERVMGFGHRVYKAKDPRGTVLYAKAKELLEEQGEDELLKICQTVEEVVGQEKGLVYNVDFYSAPVLKTLGFPVDSFVDLFAVSRVAGWAAHIIEFKQEPSLMRPRAAYVGPRDLPWVPVSERS